MLVPLDSHVHIDLAHSFEERRVSGMVAFTDLLVVAIDEEIDVLLLGLREAVDWELIIEALEALLLRLINL